MKAILNASPIIAFLDDIDGSEVLVLLCRLGWEVLVPSYVARKEILKPPGSRILATLMSQGTISEISDPPEELVVRFLDENPDLDRGESCVLLLSMKLLDEGLKVTAVLDEGPARRKAQSSGIPLIGTLGILSLLEQRNLISAETALGFRRDLASSNFWAGRGILSRAEDRVT